PPTKRGSSAPTGFRCRAGWSASSGAITEASSEGLSLQAPRTVADLTGDAFDTNSRRPDMEGVGAGTPEIEAVDHHGRAAPPGTRNGRHDRIHPETVFLERRGMPDQRHRPPVPAIEAGERIATEGVVGRTADIRPELGLRLPVPREPYAL